MAQVFKSSNVVGDATDKLEMDRYIDNYWGDELLEKIFPIPLWKLKQLFNAFPSSEVALKVSDVTSTTLVDAEWVAFDESLESALNNKLVQPNNLYYVLSEPDFEKLRLGATEIDDKLLMFIGRIGKDTDADNKDIFYVFFCIANTDIAAPFTSGEGASTGFKVPSPS